ncbi:MAG TPA: TIGR03000 domain-containing protein [Pirellulales bacterium]|jgi:uncharacterized protein (TIGR03000 family)|nr:TIGR03000 domain-containing protein [Pirellulales bacterium]
MLQLIFFFQWLGCSSSSSSSSGTVIYDGEPSMEMQQKPSAPAGGTTPPTPPNTPAPMSSSMYRAIDGSQTALLNVSVPPEAKIFVNGTETTSTGTERQYVSRGLTAGNRYEYEVRAEMVRDGNPITETKTITLGPGEQVNLLFNFDGNKEAPVAAGSKAKTKLTLHVPADAKVYLAGSGTSATGEVREFTTSKLVLGAEWKNYTVRVVSNIDGRDVSKDETITLTGGEVRDLTFDFNSNPVATTAAVTR